MWRRIAGLERELRLRLVDRRPDGACLTRHGRIIAGLAQVATDHTAEILRTAVVLREGLTEPVRVSATEPLVAEILAPALPTLWARHPELRVDLKVSNELVSLARREADIAIRMARPVGDSLVARQLTNVRVRSTRAGPISDGESPRRSCSQTNDCSSTTTATGASPSCSGSTRPESGGGPPPQLEHARAGARDARGAGIGCCRPCSSGPRTA